MKLIYRNYLNVLALGVVLAFALNALSYLHVFNVPHAYENDVTFLDQTSSQLQGAVNEARSSEEFFDVPVYNAYDEQIVTESALPQLPLKSAETHVSIFGPYPSHERTQDSVFWVRWIRVLTVAICLLALDTFFKNNSGSLPFLFLTLLFGWGSLFLSYFTNIRGQTLLSIFFPILFFMGIFSLYTALKKINIRTLLSTVAVLILSSPVILPFFCGYLYGSDARTMWFYRYKFFYFYGFDIDKISKFMADWSQRDYSWMLSAPLGLSTLFEKTAYSGWNENAAYNCLALFYIAFISLWLRHTKHLGLVFQLSITLMACALFPQYIHNGYMDFYWMSALALFFSGYYLSKKPQLHLENSFTEFELWILLCFSFSIKYESMLIFFCFVFFELIRTYKLYSLDRTIRFLFGKALYFFSASLPFLFQKRLLSHVKISDQYDLVHKILHASPYQALKNLEETHRFLIKNLFILRPHYVYSGLTLFVLLLIGRKIKTARTLFIFLYVLCIPVLIVYAYTPYDLGWHLETSAYRVFMFWNVFACAAWVYCLTTEKLSGFTLKS